MTPHFPPFKSMYSQVYGKMGSEIVMVVFFLLPWLDFREQRIPDYSEKMKRGDGDADHRRAIHFRSKVPKSGNDGTNFIISIEHFYHDDGYWSLHIYEANDSITISSQSPHHPQIWKMIHNFGKTLYPPKKGLSDPPKSKIESPQKNLVLKQPRYVHFAKNQVQFGQFRPQEPHFWSTDGYRGSPPCAIFHNPDNREI